MKHFFPPREPFNTYSHLIGAIISVIWLTLLMNKSADNPASHKIAFLIYGVSVVLMFLSSTIYHTLNVGARNKLLFQQIDHIMIYFVIAGSYTPICVVTLDGNWQTGMLIGIWAFALAGFAKKIYWMAAPRWFSTALYLLMGWVAILIFPLIWNIVPHSFIYWIAIGGVFYTVGAIIYGIKKPNPYPDTFGSHEIWHLFVIGGAFSHFWAIYFYLPNFNL